MCRDNSYIAGRETAHIRWALIDPNTADWSPKFWHLANTDDFPIVIDSDQGNAGINANWGLIPFWTKTREEGKIKANSMVNARVETIKEKPAYKNLIYTSRCVIPSTTYFEHHHVLRGKKDVAIPFVIRTTDLQPFSIAGLKTKWVDKTTGEIIESFTMVTTKANEFMTLVHNYGEHPHRMPLVIERDMEQPWIARGTPPKIVDEILDYRIPSDKLTGHPIRSIRSRKDPPPQSIALYERLPQPEIDWA